MKNAMRHPVMILLLAGLIHLASLPLFGQRSSCDLLIPVSEGFVDGRTNAAGIGPGDTICLSPGSRSWLWIRYLHGTKEAPIVIMNTIAGLSVSQFYYGIKIDSCSHIKLSGRGVPAIPYGIHIFDIEDGVGMSIEGLSTDVEIEGIEIFNTTFSGIVCKSDPDCSFNSTRDKYVMRNVSFHDNYIHDIGNEGFYIGSSFYSGVDTQCNGRDTTLLPHLIRGLQVYNNRITRTGWDGIQVSCADSACAIFHNDISYDSDAAEYNQMSGIIVGEGSGCDCFNNRIMDGKGNGIQIHGLGGNKIYNNLIVRAGRTFPDQFPHQNGIYVGDQSTIPGTGFLMAFNTIISPKDYALDFRSQFSSGNLFTNNIIMDWGLGIIQGSNITAENNFTNPNFDPTQFGDTTNGNFDLRYKSGAVNTAIPLGQLNLTFDILDRVRPFAILNDIGAFECHDSSLYAIPETIRDHAPRLTLVTDQLPDQLIILFTVDRHESVRIGLFDITGRLLTMIADNMMHPGTYEQPFSPQGLATGTYLVRMISGSGTVSKKFQLIR